MLASLLNVPKTKEELDRWSWSHRTSHTKIRAAIQAQKNVNLSDYQIDPIPLDNTTQFLQNNQQLHSDMNGQLGLQGSDLQDADLSKPEVLEGWVYSHYKEHSDAESALKI